MKGLRRYLCLPRVERGLLIEAAILLMLSRLGLWLLPFQTHLRLVARAERAGGGWQDREPPAVERIVWAVRVASRRVPGGGHCLTQALAGQVLLVRRGHPAHLRIGVAKGERGQLEAHAWVESQGQIVIGGQDSPSRFRPLPYLEGERP